MDIISTPVNGGIINASNISSRTSGAETKAENGIRQNDDAINRLRDQQSANQAEISKPETVQVREDVADNMLSIRDSESVEIAVKEVEAFLQVQNRDLSFSIDDNTDRSVVTVKDSASGEVIRQIPSEEILQLAERIKSLQQDVSSSIGVFINKQV